MRVLFVIPAFTIGGTLSSLMNILEVIKDDNLHIDFFAINPDGPYREFLAQYGRVLGGRQNMDHRQSFSLSLIVRKMKRGLEKIGIDITPLVFKRTARALDNRHYDVVIGFQEGYSTHLASYFKHTYKIAWVHCDYQSYLQLSKRKPEDKCYNRIDKVVCVSKYTLNQFMNSINHKNALYVYNLILDNKIRSLSREVIDDTLFPQNKVCIVSVGRFHPIKRFSAIPQIISLLKKQVNSEFIWYLIGGGNEEEQGKIIEAKNRYGADELVLLGEKTNPYPFMSKAYLYVCTSKSEACPYTINEAKVLGIPVVSTRFGSVNEFLTHEYNGLISNDEGMASAIARMINDQELYNNIKNNLSHFEYPNNQISESLKKDVLELQ